MDVLDGFRLVARWWFVTVPILLLAFALALVGTSSIQPEYRAQGSLLFVAPTATDGSLSNPLLSSATGLTTAAEISTLAINSPQVAEILATEGLSTLFAVGSTSRSPILLIETRAPSREIATATALRVAELIQQDLDLRQDATGTPEDQRISTSIINLAAVGGADYGGRTRLRIATVALGAVAAFGVAFLLDGSRRRRLARSEPAGTDHPTPPADPLRSGSGVSDQRPEPEHDEQSTVRPAEESAEGNSVDHAPSAG